jgi:pilus assembly protein Flp/PilA
MLDYLRTILEDRLSRLGQRGASAVEYGLLLAGIAAIICAIVFAFGGVVTGLFSGTCDTYTSSVGGSCS